ncbi:unnamed protein product [Prunus armeniaca]|uniref:Uncharacterized protein n=1 Tax=Prunus armeniaca TaxID=36596 RepID=A0A6J5XYT8_PRUAR|nr:unnamed protein product [Prunus armeniaca]
MGFRIVYGVLFLSFSCACIKLIHLMLHPVFYSTTLRTDGKLRLHQGQMLTKNREKNWVS